MINIFVYVSTHIDANVSTDIDTYVSTDIDANVSTDIDANVSTHIDANVSTHIDTIICTHSLLFLLAHVPTDNFLHTTLCDQSSDLIRIQYERDFRRDTGQICTTCHRLYSGYCLCDRPHWECHALLYW